MSVTQVVAPPPSMRACVRAFIARDTGLDAPSQLNRFPASPFCTITWFITGVTFPGESDAGPALDAVVIGGPFTAPVRTFNPGRIHAFMIVFFPDAFARLTGLDQATLADRIVPAAATLAPDWNVFLDEMFDADDDGRRLLLAETFLASRWAACGGNREPAASSWLRRLRNASGMDMLSERQFERKVKQMTGQSMRSLRCADRFERTLLNARQAAESGPLDWSNLASDSGYSDQSHLCREVRKMSGTTPGKLLELGKDDESYWLFRWWK